MYIRDGKRCAVCIQYRCYTCHNLNLYYQYPCSSCQNDHDACDDCCLKNWELGTQCLDEKLYGTNF